MDSSFIRVISVLEKATLGAVKIAILIFALYCTVTNTAIFPELLCQNYLTT